LQPSIFYKFEHRDYDNDSVGNSGYGADIKISVLPELNFYTGYSSHTEIFDQPIEIFELGGIYKTDILKLDVKYFNIDNFIPYTPRLWELLLRGAEIVPPTNFASGVSLSVNYKLGIILVQFNYSKYLDYEELSGIPQKSIHGWNLCK